MIYSKERITAYQVFTMILVMTIGEGIIYFPGALSFYMGGDGIYTIIISTLIFIGIAYMISTVIKTNPNKSFIEISSGLYGKAVTVIFVIFFLIRFYILGGVDARVFAETTDMYMLSNTPSEVVMLLILLVSAYAARGGVECIARLSQMLAIIIIVVILFLSSNTVNIADYTNVFPMFIHTPKQMWDSILYVGSAFSGFEMILVLGFFVKNPKKLFKVSASAISVISLSYLILYITTIAVFSTKVDYQLLSPTLTLVKAIDVRGGVLENIDAIVMGSWVINIFLSTSITILVVMVINGELFKFKEVNFLAYPIAGIMYLISIFPSSIMNLFVERRNKYVQIVELTVMAGIPFLLYIANAIKKKVSKNV